MKLDTDAERFKAEGNGVHIFFFNRLKGVDRVFIQLIITW